MGRKWVALFAFLIAISFVVSSQPYSVDLLRDARKAQWFNDQGKRLPFPGDDTDNRGFVRPMTAALEDGQTHSSVLETHPRWQAQGWIEGRYILTLPKNARFEATVGFFRGASGTDGVLFEVLWREKNSEQVLSALKKTYNGNLAPLSADLSQYGGHSGTLILRVRAGASSGRDWAAWKKAVIIAAGAPSATPPTQGLPGTPQATRPPAKRPALEPQVIPPQEKIEKRPIPVDKIEAANSRITRYRIDIESFNPGLKYNGIVDESEELLYFRIRFLEEEPITTKALVTARQLRPADFYRAGNKGYGRPIGNPTWLNVSIKDPFPHYIEDAVELLKQGKILSVREGREFWEIEIGVEEILDRIEPAKFSAAILGEPKTPKFAERMSNLINVIGDVQVKIRMRISRQDYQIAGVAMEGISGQTTSKQQILFHPIRTGCPALPKQALAAKGPEIPMSMLLFRIPEETGIGGWSDFTHCSFALRALQLVRDTDDVVGAKRYQEVYQMSPVPETGTGTTCGDNADSFIKPLESSHPVLIGNYYEDQKNRPGWKYSADIEDVVIETLKNPLEDVPICRLVPDKCVPADQFYDRWLSPDNPDQFCPNCYSRPYHHYGTGDEGVPYNWFYVFWLPVPSQIYSAKVRGYGGNRLIDPENPTRMTFIDGIKQYNNYTLQGKKNAYLMLGHVIHLLQDQSDPDHSLLVPHPASGKTEVDWCKEISLCTIRAVEAGISAAAICPFGLKIMCNLIAALSEYRACQDSIDEEDVGFEWLIENAWNISEAHSLIEATGIRRQPDYDSFFSAMGESAIQKVKELGFEPDYQNSNSLGCGTLFIPPEIPAADPNIDFTNRIQKERYLRLADDLATAAVCLGAGFMEYFYEVVNHPPYVRRVVVTYGDIGTPGLYEKEVSPEYETKYEAYWEDIYDETTGKRVVRRAFRKMVDEPLDLGRPASVYIELGPPLGPSRGKIASRINLKVGSLDISPTLRIAGDGRPVYMATIPAGALAMNCGASEVSIPIEIQAWDQAAHLSSRTPTGDEIDRNPITIAKVNTDAASFLFEGYEPGTDSLHVLRVAPTPWETAISKDPAPIPPPGSPPWALPTIRIPAPSFGTKTDVIYLKAFSPVSTGRPPVVSYVPTSCPVHWAADSLVVGPSGEGAAGQMYNFLVNIPNSDSAVARLEIITNPSTARGIFTIRINYAVGTNHRTLGIPIQIY